MQVASVIFVRSVITSVPNVNLDEPVAFGVVSFEARPKFRNESGIWVDWSESSRREVEAFDVRIVIARKTLAGKLKQSADWDSSPLLGAPSKADRNKELEVHSTLIPVGIHEKP